MFIFYSYLIVILISQSRKKPLFIRHIDKFFHNSLGVPGTSGHSSCSGNLRAGRSKIKSCRDACIPVSLFYFCSCGDSRERDEAQRNRASRRVPMWREVSPTASIPDGRIPARQSLLSSLLQNSGNPGNSPGYHPAQSNIPPVFHPFLYRLPPGICSLPEAQQFF